MIKIVTVWRHNPDLEAAACEEHYYSKHTAMALSVLADIPGFLKYTQNTVLSHSVNVKNSPVAEEREPEFHMMLELYFRDEESLGALFARPEMAFLFQDHPNFIDHQGDPSQSVYVVRERVALERGIDGSLMAPVAPASLVIDWNT